MQPRLDAESEIVAALRRIIRAVDLHSRHLLEEFGLTAPQISVLQVVHHHGRTTAGALAREVHISAATVSGIVARLERQGLLERRPGPEDRRQVVVRLTDAGETVLATAPSLLQDRFRARLAGLDDWERTMILAVLQRIAGLMDAEDLDAAPHLVADGRGIDPTASPSPQEV